MSFSEKDILATLGQVLLPYTQKSVVESKVIKNLKLEGTDVSFDLELGYPAKHMLETLRKEAITAVKSVSGVDNVSVHASSKIVAHAVQRGVKLLPGVKNIIAVASGKGGVGKSTTAANLALAMAKEGATVGLLDADIYGPSQPVMLGVDDGREPEVTEGGLMRPVMAHGLQVMSIGFLVDSETPMVWRGPMVMQALDQLLNQTAWEDVDYLIVDLPPGTGDTQLSLAQKVPVTGAVIVTTPQDIALLDARKGLKMFEKVNIPIFGVIENMSQHVCSQCGHEEAIFGSGGGTKMCEDYQVDLLGRLPLELAIREMSDQGNPAVAGAPDSHAAETYCEIARRVMIKVADRAKDMSGKFPEIIVESA